MYFIFLHSLHHKIYFQKALLNSGVQNQGRKKLIFQKTLSSACIKIKQSPKTQEKSLVF